jgi:hypothetical protein
VQQYAAEVRCERGLSGEHGVLRATRHLLRARLHGLLSEHLRADDCSLLSSNALL